MLHFLNRRGMVDRVDEVPKFHGAIAATLQCRRQLCPASESLSSHLTAPGPTSPIPYGDGNDVMCRSKPEAR
jgi:hypothetical protein